MKTRPRWLTKLAKRFRGRAPRPVPKRLAEPINASVDLFQSPDDLAIAVELLSSSGIFDPDAYRASNNLAASVCAEEHYLKDGWHMGLEPNANFESDFLYPYFCSVGFEGPPALTYVRLRAAGSPVYATRKEAQKKAGRARNSGLFDEAFYKSQFQPFSEGLDPFLHYMMVGERLGYAPSEDFDPRYYFERHLDGAHSGRFLLDHYVARGRIQKMAPVSAVSKFAYDRSKLDLNRETVLVISHEAAPTGAPILIYNVARRLSRKYNVVALLLAGGGLVEDFEACCAAVIGHLKRKDRHDAEASDLARRLVATYDFKYVIANSIETRGFSPHIANTFLPVVTLMHEFASYARPKATMTRALDWSAEIVFSTEVTAESARAELPHLAARRLHVLPQGQCEVPAVASEDSNTRASVRPPENADDFIVLGCGSVILRKGVDVFIACAAAAKDLIPDKRLRFVWIGPGYKPERDMVYSCYLAEQIRRSHLSDRVTMLDEVSDINSAYAAADAMFLSSRLDPLPNVAIDAAMRGMPVVCFEGASGFAELLRQHPITSRMVVPYLDATAAAKVIIEIAEDQSFREQVSDVTRRLAEAKFDMERYVERLDEIGRAAGRLMEPRKEAFSIIRGDSLFDEAIYSPRASLYSDRDEAIRNFVNGWAGVGTGVGAGAIPHFRRPCPGFHPQIYAEKNFAVDEMRLRNPLADFIQRGKPAGPWIHEVILPDRLQIPSPPEGLKTAIHGHFFYPELAIEFVYRLGTNQFHGDLLLTTNTDEKAKVLEEHASRYGREDVQVRIVPNRGRDIGAFLTAYRQEILDGYDVVGHFHGKRSLSADKAVGESWREFLWQHLIGGAYPMADLILDRFARDENLGLVFANDPHLPDWDGNKEIATDLARRMGMNLPLPRFFEFPVGAMFWARPKALRSLFDLSLQWEDYPKEPLPYDGTMLHALERLLPLVAQHAGFGFATTHVPGITW